MEPDAIQPDMMKQLKVLRSSKGHNLLQTGFSYAPVIRSPSESKTSSYDAVGSKQLQCFPTKKLHWQN